MKRDELLKALREVGDADAYTDRENDHVNADNLLLDYIDDPQIRAAFEAIPKWYA